jgi:hypothetical protein
MQSQFANFGLHICATMSLAGLPDSRMCRTAIRPLTISASLSPRKVRPGVSVSFVHLRHKPDLACATLYLGFAGALTVLKRIQLAAKFDNVLVALLPVVEELEVFQQLIKCRFGQGVLRFLKARQ